MKRIVGFAIIAITFTVSGVTLSDVSVAEVSNLLRSYYRDEFNTGLWDDEYSKLLPFRFLLDNGSCRYVISLPEYHHSDGMAWDCYAVTNNTLKQLGSGSDSTTLWCWPYQLFMIERKAGRREIVCCNYGKQIVVDDTGSERKYAADLKWYVLAEDASGELVPKVLDKSIAEMLTEKDVIDIVRVTPCLFKGKNAEIVMNVGKEVANLVQMLPCKSQGGECVELSAEQKCAVAKMYVANLEQRLPNVSCGSVLMMIGDMNGDGFCDAYVSSDAEKSVEGGYWWQLYSGRTKRFTENDEEVKIHSFEKVVIPSRVKALAEEFYCVMRKMGGRYVIVLRVHEGCYVPTGYLEPTNIVRINRKKYGYKGVDFYSCLPSVGWCGIGDHDDLFKDYHAPLECIRSLVCEQIEVK